MASAATLRPAKRARRAVGAAGLLHAARSRIASAHAWTPGDGRGTALTASGERVAAGDHRARRFDALAALQRAAWSEHPREGVRFGAYDASSPPCAPCAR